MVFRFDRYHLDAERRVLTRDGKTVPLTPKVFQTLLILVENRDRVMSKEDLCSRIWSEQFVEESNLTQNISVLRRVLDENHTGKSYITTMHGHGYRFAETVFEQTVSETAASVQGSLSEKQSHVIWQRIWLGLGICVVLLGVGVFASLWMHRAASTPLKHIPATVQVETLTRLPGAQYEPSRSPDGKSLAFAAVSPDGAVSSIYIQTSGELQPKSITSGDGIYSSPVWSWDGKRLAFIRFAGAKSGIFIYDTLNKNTRMLAPLFPTRYGLKYRHLDWSPDGSVLVVDDKSTNKDPLSLYLVSVSTGEKRRLTFADMDIIGDVAPRFSPDGADIAFVRVKYQGQNDVYTVPATTGPGKLIVESGEQVSDVDWRDATNLLFVARFDDQYRFWLANIRKPQAPPELAMQFGSDLPIQFSMDRSSHQLVLSAYSSNLDIWSLQTSGAAQWKPVISTPAQDVSPAFSPDGKQIAFRSDLGGREQIWVSASDGSNARRLQTDIPAVHTWDFDGKSILFKPRHRDGLYSVSLEEPHTIKLVSEFGASHPMVSPDGKSIFVRKGPVIFRMDRTTGTLQKLTSLGGAPLQCSADGRYLYFAHGRMGERISRIDLSTLEETTILDSLMPGYAESWAVTEGGVYYLGQHDGVTSVLFHDFSSGKDRDVSLFEGDLPPVGDSGFAISPDGKTLLVVRGAPTASNISELRVIRTTQDVHP